MFLSILERVKNEITRDFEQFLENNHFENGQEMMEGVLSFYLQLAGNMGDRFLLLHRHDAYELARTNPACRQCLETIYNCVLDVLEKAIVLGQRDGSIGEMSARKTALIILSMVDGLVRFKTYNLYHAGALYEELMGACRRMLKNVDNRETLSKC